MELIKQILEVDEKSGGVVLFNKINNDSLLKSNMEERNAVGKATGSNFKPVASLDVNFLLHDPKGLGQKVYYAQSGTWELRKALKEFLMEYPEYTTSFAKI